MFVNAHTINIGSVPITVSNLTLTGLAQLHDGASITINGDFQLTLALIYSGDVTVNGNMTWGAGNFYNSGTVNVNGITSLIGYLGPGTQGDKYTTKPFNMNGGAIWVEGRLLADNGGSFTLPAGQTFTVNGSNLFLGGLFGPLNGVFDLQGTMDLGSGILDVINLQSFNNTGNLIIQSGAILTNNSIFNNAGLLAGTGTLNNNSMFTQSGTISPGSSPGTLTMNTLPSGTTTTYIEMQGSAAPGTDYDQIAVTGAGAISGTLDISFLNGYEPTVGDEFIIMTCSGGCSGSFSNIVYPGSNPNVWQIDMTNPNQVKLVLAQSLPVELVSLSAKALNGNTAQIRWETAFELDNDGFFIEKSSDGHWFEEIGFAKGASTSHQVKTYKFLDEAFREDAYYRLRQVDFDGKTTLSHVVFLQFEGKIGTGISIFPNPAVKELIVSLKPNQQPTFLEIKNSFGGLILREEVSPGKNSQQVDVSNLPAGIYFLCMEGFAPVQFVKQ